MKNVGRYDREVRFIAAALLAVLGYLESGTARLILWVLMLVPLFTGLFRYCPLWTVFKIDTYREKRGR
ncbi:MAG TPA: DUF2892 domain-containing protein [bacterium]|nr:DUF2892 domain-containing protein [bacterium]